MKKLIIIFIVTLIAFIAAYSYVEVIRKDTLPFIIASLVEGTMLGDVLTTLLLKRKQ